MFNLLKRLCGNKLREEEIKSFANGLSAVVILTILADADKHLTEEDRQKITEYRKAEEFGKIMSLTEKKYSPKDWESMLEREVEPVLDDYITNVVLS